VAHIQIPAATNQSTVTTHKQKTC